MSDAKEAAPPAEGADKKDEKGAVEDKKTEPVKNKALKFGDYTIQVHLIECRDLKGRGVGDMSDPVGVMECMGEVQHTKIHSKELSPVFDEVVYFEFRNKYPAEIESSKVLVKIMDANTFPLRDVLIGLYEFDLSGVYYNKHHEIHRTWVALTDPSGKEVGIQGYAKLSIVCLGPGDEQYTHESSEVDNDEMGMMTVLMPPQIEQTPKELKLRFHLAENLPKMDDAFGGGKCDGYCSVDFAGTTNLRTYIVPNNLDPIWDEELVIPVMEPILNNTIKVTLFDHDKGLNSDDRIATALLDYVNIKKDTVGSIDGFTPMRWINLYGAPEGCQHNYASKMNRKNVEGSHFRGRVLMSMGVFDVEKPVRTVNRIIGGTKDPATRPRPEEKLLPACTSYTIQLDLYEGSEVCKRDKVYVELVVGAKWKSARSEERKPENGRVRFYQCMELTNNGMPQDVNQCPDVFVFFCSDKRRLAFRRYSFAELYNTTVQNNWNIPPAWTNLQEDLAINELQKDEFPGLLLLSLRVGPTVPGPVMHNTTRPLKHGFAPELGDIKIQDLPSTAEGDEDEDDIMNMIQRAPTVGTASTAKAGTLTLTVISGAGLPIMDKDTNSCDPFVEVSILSEKRKTATLKKTLDPVWNEAFQFKDVTIDTPVNFKVVDYDLMGDDLVGTCSLHIRSLHSQAGTPVGLPLNYRHTLLITRDAKNIKKGDAKSGTIVVNVKFDYYDASTSLKVEEKVKKEAIKRSSTFGLKKGAAETFGSDELGYPQQSQYELRAFLYMARGLPSTDSNSLADPYVVVKLCGQSLRFSTKTATLNPQWFERQSIAVVLPAHEGRLDLAPDIQIYVMDYDKIEKDDNLGRCRYSCTKAAKNYVPSKPYDLHPKWIQLLNWSDQPVEGARVLIAFQLLSFAELDELKSKELPVIIPKTIPVHLEILTLGLRNLQSTLGVHKTFLQFELPNGKRFRTDPSRDPNPKNPNFLQVIKIPIDIPINPLFAPMVDIEVRDVIFGGIIKRLIGTGALDLARFMDVANEDSKEWKAKDSRLIMSDDEMDAKKAADKASELARKKEELERKMALAAKEEEERKGREQAELEARIKAGEIQLAEAEAKQKERMERDSKDQKENDQKEGPTAKLLGDVKSDDVKVDIKEGKGDAGHGLGDLPEDHHDDKNPLLSDTRDAKDKVPVNQEFEDKGAEKYHLEDQKPEMPLDDLPDYMRGRTIVDDELEDYMIMKPFHEVTLWTGQHTPGMFGAKRRKMGNYKGLISLLASKEDKTHITNNEVLSPRDRLVRLYILRGINLNPRDDNGTSDPYLIIKCGKKEISTRSRHLNNTNDPDFYEAFELNCVIPGDSVIEIEVWDWDGVGDDMIGKTSLDIEDRWFTPEWRNLEPKPVERRTLMHGTSNASQGKLEMWLDILKPLQAKTEPLINIKPAPAEEFELRVIVWGTREITIKDTFTDQNDLFVTGGVQIKGLKRQETDTHLRSKKGLGNFNWRMKWPVCLPPKTRDQWPRLRFQVWDFDFFSFDDSICEAVLNLRPLALRAFKQRKRIKVYHKGKDRFWIENLRHPNYGKMNQGKMEISIELMPLAIANAIPAGFGRSDPNQNPHLPEPEGRIKWSLFHPFDMLKEILGEKLYRKLCCGCFCILFIAACVFMAPMIVSNVITKILTP